MTLTLPSRPALPETDAPGDSTSLAAPGGPAVPTTVDEVSLLIRQIAAGGRRIAVRSGGTGSAGAPWAGDPGRLVPRDVREVSTAGLRDVRIDPARRVAEVQAGVTWRELYAALHGSGLRAPAALDRHAGVVATVLQSALAHDARLGGTPAGALRAAEIVDARGRRRWVCDPAGTVLFNADLHDPDLHGPDLHGPDLQGADLHDADLHDADLLWALRGGGGGMVAVTAVQLDLSPAPAWHEQLHLPLGDDPRPVLRRYLHAFGTLPSSTVITTTFTTPPGTRVPGTGARRRGCAQGTGRPVLTVRFTSADLDDRHHPSVEALRDLASAAPVPPADTTPISHTTPHPPIRTLRCGTPSTVRGGLAIDTLCEAVLMRVIQALDRGGFRRVHVIDRRGGILGREGVGSRPQDGFVVVATAAEGDIRSHRVFRDGFDLLAGALAPWASGSVTPGELAPWRSLAGSFSAVQRRRLRDIAATVDPDAVFCTGRPL
jgi:hypothetical protein